MRRPLFNDRDSHAELSSADGADIAPGPGADDDEIECHLSEMHVGDELLELCLVLRLLAQVIGPKIDLFALLVHPSNRMPVLIDCEFREIFFIAQIDEYA